MPGRRAGRRGPPGAAQHWCGNPSRESLLAQSPPPLRGKPLHPNREQLRAGGRARTERRTQGSNLGGARRARAGQTPTSRSGVLQPETPAFPSVFPGPRKREPKMVRLSRPPRVGFEASVSRRAYDSESFALGKVKPWVFFVLFCFVLCFAVLERSLCPFQQISLRINKVLALPRP